MLRKDSTKLFSPEDLLRRETRIIWGTVVVVLAAVLILGIVGKVWGATPAQVDSIAAYYDSQHESPWKEGAFAFTRFSPYWKPLIAEYQKDDVHLASALGLSYRYSNWFGGSLEFTVVGSAKPRTSLITKIVLW